MNEEALKRIAEAKATGSENLDLSGLDLDVLPEQVRELTQLRQLDLVNNRLTYLPEWLVELQVLELINLSFNHITELPDSLGQLAQLQYLYVWGNQLTELPDSLGQLAQLQHLYVWFNHLTELPDSLGQLVQLQHLYISDNQLTELPDSLGQLVQLQYFDVSENQLTELPDSLGQLAQLQHLYVSGNQLIELPGSLGRLNQLQYLDVSRNQLTVLPESVGRFASLQALDVAFNDLSALPDGFRHQVFQELWLQGNSRLGLDRTLLGKYIERYRRRSTDKRSTSPATILAAYFGARDKDGRALNEIKLVLVGRGAAGKTSIVQRLVKGTFRRKHKETQGIDISRWQLACGDDDVTVNLWDFAGQVITHATHQFFLSSNSVYVLVLTGREDAQKSDADYWLRLIRAFANDTDGNIAPVIVVLNKWEEHPFKLDRNLLKEKYPFIVDFIETDCRTGLGIDSLKAKLAETVEPMDIVRQPFKLSWWKIKEQLEKAQRRKNYLPYSEFQATCAKLGEADTDGQRILAEVFHALGIALNYGQDERLRNSTVLNPRWVTDGIYTLLRAVPDDGSAELTLDRVRLVLPKEPDEMRFYLIELMRRFDLAFPLNETGDRWLVPQRLPPEQPELGAEWQTAQNITRLQYRYPVIPEGLMPRFITRSYPLSEGLEDGEPLPRWVNGVILEDRGARALVRVDEEDREIQVVVIGEESARLSLLGVIQADFRTIHDDIGGLEQQEFLEIEGQAGVYVPVQTLLADEAKKQNSSASTPQGTISVDPSIELNRLSEPAARDEEQWRARVFISYSSKDAKLKDQLMIRLKPMRESAGLIECWHDRLITPGEVWDGEIKKQLEQADVILLLVSAQFLASDYIRGVEIQRAVELSDAEKARVIPVILEQCGWEKEIFGKFNGLPRKGKPIRDTKPQRNAWYEVEKELREVFEDLRKKQTHRFIRSQMEFLYDLKP
jgi:internalin A